MKKFVGLWSLVFGLATIFASFAVAADSKPPDIRAFVDRKTIYIGDRIKYTLKVIPAKNSETEFPKFKDNVLGDFEIKDSEQKERKGVFGKHVLSNFYYITAYSIGRHEIPSIEIRYRQKGSSDWNIVKTDAITVTVESVLPKNKKASDIKDIKGPMSFYEINWILVMSAGGALALTVLSIIIYKKIKRKKPLKLPHERAIDELEAIKAEFARTGDVKEYYVGISDSIRHYIERIFKLKAPEMTTEEFLASLKDSIILSYEQKGLLKEFMEACDLVKFAKYAPAKKEIEGVLVTARNFIEETKSLSIVHEAKV